MDQLILAHSKYLNNIVDKSLLSTQSLLKDLTNVLDIIIQFCRAQEALYNAALEESVRRAHRDQRIRERELQGKWGIEPEEEEEEEEYDGFQVPEELQQLLEKLSKEYETILKTFREALSKQSDENLRFLAVRIDFNDYYENKERKSLPNMIDAYLPGEDLKS